MRIDKRLGLFVALAAVFITCLVVGDLLGVKLVGGTVPVTGWKWTTTVGMLAFPITFLLTDLLNEFYGKAAARFVTWVGFGMALLALALLTASTAVPYSPLMTDPGWKGLKPSEYDAVFGGSRLMLVASITAYLVSQFVDITVFHLLKKMTGSRLLWLRATGSTVASQLVDTVVINAIAWSGTLPWSEITTIMVSAYFLKLAIAIGMTPLIYAGHAVVERLLDMRPVQLDPQGEPVEAAVD